MLEYLVTNISSIFTYTTFFQFHSIARGGFISVVNMHFETTPGLIVVYINNLYSNPTSGVWIDIRGSYVNGTLEANFAVLSSLSPDVWHKAEVIVQGRSTVFKINNKKIHEWIAPIDNPFAGINRVRIENVFTSNAVWIDNVSIVNTKVSHSPVWKC